MIISFKQTKILVFILCLVTIGLILLFPYFKKPATNLERTTYCDGYTTKMKQLDPKSIEKEVYTKCITDYAQS